MNGEGLGVFLIAALSTGIVLVPIRRLLIARGVLDRPNHRSSHSVPTVRGGGLAMIGGFVCSLPLWGRDLPPRERLTLLFALLTLALVSFWDDVRGVAVRFRLPVHLAAAAAGVWTVSRLPAGPFGAEGAVFAGLGLVYVAGFTNAFNFMDGINGLASLQAVVTGLGSAWLASATIPHNPGVVLVGMAISGVGSGFLPFNFPRARAFMGDVGSAPLGFMLALLAVWMGRTAGWWAAAWMALLQANFLLDTMTTFVRRATRKERLHEAHREHFYQRLVRSGFSHTSVALTQAAIQGLVVLLLARTAAAPPSTRLIVTAAVLAAWTSYFVFAEAVFVRAGRRIP